MTVTETEPKTYTHLAAICDEVQQDVTAAEDEVQQAAATVKVRRLAFWAWKLGMPPLNRTIVNDLAVLNEVINQIREYATFKS